MSKFEMTKLTEIRVDISVDIEEFPRVLRDSNTLTLRTGNSAPSVLRVKVGELVDTLVSLGYDPSGLFLNWIHRQGRLNYQIVREDGGRVFFR